MDGPAGSLARFAAAAAFVASLAALPGPATAADVAEPAEVTIGAYVNDVQHVDLATHSYVMDLLVWLRWTDPAIDPSATLQVMNPYELWGMTRAPLYPEPRKLPDGSLYQAIRFQGRFSNAFPLRAYPFDRQELLVALEDDAHDEHEVVYVPDADSVLMEPGVSLPDYDIGTPTLSISNDVYPTTFGDTSEAEPVPYSRATISVPVSRPVIPYMIKLALPIFLVVLVAALSFLLHSSYVEARIGMGITALLTLVALQLTMNNGLPEVGYLMMLDLVYIASSAFVLAVMAQAVATSWIAQRGEHDRAVALDRRMVVVSGTAYVVASGRSCWLPPRSAASREVGRGPAHDRKRERAGRRPPSAPRCVVRVLHAAHPSPARVAARTSRERSSPAAASRTISADHSAAVEPGREARRRRPRGRRRPT